MKISGVNISGGIRLDPPVAPTPSGPSKFVVGARRVGSFKGAAYIYDTDGTGELKITASDGAGGDQFGASVAMTDTKIVVGAQGDDDAGSSSGSVYVYNTDGTGELKITASDGAASDSFGYSVAISGTKVVVGARGDDDAGSSSGSAYVYNLDGSGEVKVTASDGAASDSFGYSVAISDTHIVVGAQGDDGNQGSVYVYNLDGTGEVKITASDAAINDYFGLSVAISDTHIAVGSQMDDDLGSGSGSVYVYNLDGTGEVKITPSDGAADDRFGWAVAITDTHIVVGAKNHNVVTGAVYIYNLDGTGEVKVTASDGAASDSFGYSVAISGTKVLVGARDDDGSSGSVYVYNTDGSGEQKITASDAAANDNFGTSVAAN